VIMILSREGPDRFFFAKGLKFTLPKEKFQFTKWKRIF
jgi:hypothetical protein